MSIPLDQIHHIAKLAKLNINSTETEQLSTKLNNILDLVNTMSEVNTDNVEPMAHAIHQNQLLREDVSNADINRDKNQQLAPSVNEFHYIVPQVIE